MKFVMRREPTLDGATLSELFADGGKVCDVLEDPVREQLGVPVGNWKIPGDTAIPAGTYDIRFERSARFGPQTLTVVGVPGFIGIRIHGGNTSKDTEGCLLPGTRNAPNAVKDSQKALKIWKDLVLREILAGRPTTLTILPEGTT